MKSLHLLNPGTYTDRSGHRFDATPEVLKEIAASYDPALHEAPLVVGHPTHDGPAHGWVKSLSFGEGGLEAMPDQVSGDLTAAVGAGHLKKLSAAFWPPDHAKNPTPGKWHLRHVGFLGAMPPAAKGLRPIQLADGEEGIVELSEPDMPWFMRQVGAAFRAVRDYLIGEKGVDAADKVLPAYTVESLERIATQAESGASSLAFSEEGDGMTKEELAAQTAKEAELKAKEVQLGEQETGLAERERAIAAKEAAAQKADALEFVEGLASEGKVLPREVPALVEVLSGAPAATAFELSEGEGDAAKKVQTTAGAFLRDFLKGLPKRVDFTERAAAGETVDLSDAEEISRAAQQYQVEEAKAGRVVTASAAVAHVTAVK